MELLTVEFFRDPRITFYITLGCELRFMIFFVAFQTKFSNGNKQPLRYALHVAGGGEKTKPKPLKNFEDRIPYS